MTMTMVEKNLLVCPRCLKRQVEFKAWWGKWVCSCGWHCSVKPEPALYDVLESKYHPPQSKT